ncbi:hypothetical protein KY330_02480 [Candidatus Woesearchaeota archaeon]|nr:hypothetical protein [Candidatus Woesearchaeota archaeon]
MVISRDQKIVEDISDILMTKRVTLADSSVLHKQEHVSDELQRAFVPDVIYAELSKNFALPTHLALADKVEDAIIGFSRSEPSRLMNLVEAEYERITPNEFRKLQSQSMAVALAKRDMAAFAVSGLRYIRSFAREAIDEIVALPDRKKRYDGKVDRPVMDSEVLVMALKAAVDKPVTVYHKDFDYSLILGKIRGAMNRRAKELESKEKLSPSERLEKAYVSKLIKAPVMLKNLGTGYYRH